MITEDRYKNKYDVIIIGAGPGGSTAARFLVKGGYKVLIIESKKLPRYKVCSGLIIGRAQDLLVEYFGEIPSDVYCNEKHLSGVKLCKSGNTFFDIPVDKGNAWNVWRSKLDFYMAKETGADIMDEHRFLNLEENNSHIELIIQKPDKTTVKISTSFVIGADGGNSRVRNILNPELKNEVTMLAFKQQYCSGTIDLDDNYYYMFIDPSLKSIYTWLHFKDGQIVYGAGVKKGENLTKSFDLSTEYLKDTFNMKIDKINRTTGCVGTDMPITNNFYTGKGKVLLAGESAGFMNIFGEGISSALATGAIAAKAIEKKENDSNSLVSIYDTMLVDEKKQTVESWKIAKTLLGREIIIY